MDKHCHIENQNSGGKCNTKNLQKEKAIVITWAKRNMP